MSNLLNAYKPAASARMHLLLSALMWTVVGSLLLFFGVRWVWTVHEPYPPWLVGAAIVAGLLKGRLVLERTAGRMIERIQTRGDGYCLGGFLSFRSWGFVAVMVAAGRVLRGGLLPRGAVGFVYAAVGTALLVTSRQIWRAWSRRGPDPSGVSPG